MRRRRSGGAAGGCTDDAGDDGVVCMFSFSKENLQEKSLQTSAADDGVEVVATAGQQSSWSSLLFDM